MIIPQIIFTSANHPEGYWVRFSLPPLSLSDHCVSGVIYVCTFLQLHHLSIGNARVDSSERRGYNSCRNRERERKKKKRQRDSVYTRSKILTPVSRGRRRRRRWRRRRRRIKEKKEKIPHETLICPSFVGRDPDVPSNAVDLQAKVRHMRKQNRSEPVDSLSLSSLSLSPPGLFSISLFSLFVRMCLCVCLSHCFSFTLGGKERERERERVEHRKKHTQ